MTTTRGRTRDCEARPPTDRRAGFTLIELVVALVLAGVVSLLVYGAALAAHDTQTRISSERHSLQTAMAMRLLLESALAGAQAAALATDTMFVLEDRMGPGGIPQDRLTFVASGDLPPLSPGDDWIATLEPTPEGLRLTGRPLGLRGAPRLLALLPGVTGLAVRVRQDSVWAPEWSFPMALPRAVELIYWTSAGPTGLPLAVAVALGQGH